MLIVGVSYVSIWLITFVFTVVQARYLDPSRFGQLSLALSYAAFLTIFVDFGTSTLVSRIVARRAQDDGLLGTTLLMRSLLSSRASSARVIWQSDQRVWSGVSWPWHRANPIWPYRSRKNCGKPFQGQPRSQVVNRSLNS